MSVRPAPTAITTTEQNGRGARTQALAHDRVCDAYSVDALATVSLTNAMGLLCNRNGQAAASVLKFRNYTPTTEEFKANILPKAQSEFSGCSGVLLFLCA